MQASEHAGRLTRLRQAERAVLKAALTWHTVPGGLTEAALRAACAQLAACSSETSHSSPHSSPLTATAPSTRVVDCNAAKPLQRPRGVERLIEPGQFSLYSDGSALGNPGPSGCGWVIVAANGIVAEGFEALGHGTNQVAEIRAAAHGLNDLPAGSSVEVFTDSLYVVKTMCGAFKKKANLDHWQFLDEAVRRHRTVRFHHVRGHAGHDFNEAADRLANRGAARSRGLGA